MNNVISEQDKLDESQTEPSDDDEITGAIFKLIEQSSPPNPSLHLQTPLNRE